MHMEGGHDDDDSDRIKHFPTPKETLEATSLVSNYIDTINNPIARKLEGLLGSFRYQICVHRGV